MTEQAARAWFKPVWWTWLAAGIIGLFGRSALVAFPAATWTGDAEWMLLLAIVALCGAWAATTFLALFSEGLSILYQFLFLAFWGMAVMGAYVYAREVQTGLNEQLIAQMVENRQRLRQRAVAEAREAETEEGAREERLRNDRFSRYAGRVKPEVLEQMRAVDDQILAEMRAAADRYKAVLEANPVEGPEGWLRVATLDELELWRSRNQAVYEASRAYNDFLDGLEERYNERLEALALEPPADRYAIAEMERLLQYWEYSGARDQRALDAELSATALRALDLLRDAWGEWKFDRASSRVTFKDPGVEMRFFSLIEEGQMIDQQRSRLRRLQREFDRQGGRRIGD